MSTQKIKKIILDRAGATGRGKPNNCSGYTNREGWSAGPGAPQRPGCCYPACMLVSGEHNPNNFSGYPDPGTPKPDAPNNPTR